MIVKLGYCECRLWWINNTGEKVKIPVRLYKQYESAFARLYKARERIDDYLIQTKQKIELKP